MERSANIVSAKIDAIHLVSSLLVAGSLAFAYSETLSLMMVQWWTNDMYSYAFLIPMISAYMVWIRREYIRSIQIAPHYWGGIGAGLAGLLLLLVGNRAGIQVMSEVSLIVSLIGLVLLLYGAKFFTALLFPLAYLLFMLPSWGLLTDHMQLPFQLFSARLGTAIAELVGVPVFLQDAYIFLPNITLEVAKECSGLNYLIAVLALSSAAAHLYISGWPRKFLLVFGSIAVAIFTNGLRVGLISIFAYYGLSGDLHGPLHIFQGVVISLVGYAAILVGIGLLSSTPVTIGNCDQGRARSPSPPQLHRSGWLHTPYLGFATSGIYLLFGAYLMWSDPKAVALEADLSSLPYQIGGWEGAAAPDSLRVFRKLGVDSELSRSYRSKSRDQVDLYIAYYSYQRQGKELVNATTVELLEGNGSTHMVPVTGGLPVSVRFVTQVHGRGTQLILYAYLVGGRVITDRYLAKIMTAWEVLTVGRTNGAIFLVMRVVESESEASESLEEMKAFIQEAFPFIARVTSQSVKG